MATKKKADPSGLSDDAKTIIVVLLLVFAFPVGLILMWLWTEWPKWVKWLLSLILITPLVLMLLFFFAIFGAVNRAGHGYPMQRFDRDSQYEQHMDLDDKTTMYIDHHRLSAKIRP